MFPLPIQCIIVVQDQNLCVIIRVNLLPYFSYRIFFRSYEDSYFKTALNTSIIFAGQISKIHVHVKDIRVAEFCVFSGGNWLFFQLYITYPLSTCDLRFSKGKSWERVGRVNLPGQLFCSVEYSYMTATWI